MKSISELKERIIKLAIERLPNIRNNRAYEYKALIEMLHRFPLEEDITIYDVKEENNYLIICYYEKKSQVKNTIKVDYSKENEFSIVYDKGFEDGYGRTNYTNREVIEQKIVARPDGGFEYYKNIEEMDTKNCPAYYYNSVEQSHGERYDKSGIQTKTNRIFFKPQRYSNGGERLYHSRTLGNLSKGYNPNLEKLHVELERVSYDCAKVESHGVGIGNIDLNCEGYQVVEHIYLPELTHYSGITHDTLIGSVVTEKSEEEIIDEINNSPEQLSTEQRDFLMRLSQKNDRANLAYNLSNRNKFTR